MLVQVIQLPGESIIIATMTGEIFKEDLATMYEQSLPLIADLPGPIYRITDALDASIEFGELVNLMSEMGQNRPGSTQDPRIRPILVGTHPDAHLLAEGMRQKQYGAITMPLFEDLDAAITYAREQIAAGS